MATDESRAQANPLRRKYAAVIYDFNTQTMLREWAQDNGFDLTAKWNGSKQAAKSFRFHTSLMMSIGRHRAPAAGVFDIHPAVVKPVALDVFDEGNQLWIPVLHVADCYSINVEYDTLCRVYNVIPSFTTFLPHISLSYKRGVQYDRDQLNQIQLPTFPLKYDKIEIEDAPWQSNQ